MGTTALIRCNAGSAGEIAIIATADGAPDRLGVILAEVCTDILYGPRSMAGMLKESDPELRMRVCGKEGLSAMVLGLLHAQWDAISESTVSFGEHPEDEVTLRSRYSHDQFRLVPVTLIDDQSFDFVYRLKFKDHPPLPFFTNPMRVWIKLEGPGGFEGWPEDYLAWRLKLEGTECSAGQDGEGSPA